MRKRKKPFYRTGQKLYVRVRVPDYPGHYWWPMGVVVLGFRNGKYTLRIIDTHLDGVVKEGIPRKYIKRAKGKYFRARKSDLWKRTKTFQLYNSIDTRYLDTESKYL